MNTVTVTKERREILQALACSNSPIGPTAISERVNSSRHSVSNMLSKMEQEEMVEREEGQRGKWVITKSGLSITNAGDGAPQGAPVSPPGEEAEERHKPPAASDAENMRAFTDEELLDRGYHRIPEVEGGAGPEREPILEEVDGEEVLPGWFIRQEYGVEPSRLLKARVVGDSMKPQLLPGQKVYCARVEGEPLRDGAIYAIGGPHGVQLKRLVFDQDEDEDGVVRQMIWLWSDNEDRPRLRLTLDQFERDYRVLAVALKKDSFL